MQCWILRVLEGVFPSDLHDSPSLISMLPSEARNHLEDFEKHMLRPAQESDLIQ